MWAEDGSAVSWGLFLRRDRKTPEIEASGPSNVRKLTLRISGMHCSGCASSIKGFLKGQEGVVKAEVDFQSGRAVILYDSSGLKMESILTSPIFKEPSIFEAEVEEDALQQT